jgi:predicted transcriptional regulator YheO
MQIVTTGAGFLARVLGRQAEIVLHKMHSNARYSIKTLSELQREPEFGRIFNIFPS